MTEGAGRLTLDDLEDPIGALGLEVARERIYPRLLAAGSPLAQEVPTRQVTGSLVSALVLDLEHSVRALSRADFDRLGGEGRAVSDAHRNLLATALPTPARVQGGGLDYYVIADESVHIASLALEPQKLCDAVAQQPGEGGVLLVAPNRHVVAWHVVRDLAVLANINALAAFASDHFAEAPHPVTAGLLWWDGERLYDLVTAADDGSLSLSPPKGFGEILEKFTNGTSD